MKPRSGPRARLSLVARDLLRGAGLGGGPATRLPARPIVGPAIPEPLDPLGGRPWPIDAPLALPPAPDPGAGIGTSSRLISHWSGAVRAPLAASLSRNSRSLVATSTVSVADGPPPWTAASDTRSRIRSSALWRPEYRTIIFWASRPLMPWPMPSNTRSIAMVIGTAPRIRPTIADAGAGPPAPAPRR